MSETDISPRIFEEHDKNVDAMIDRVMDEDAVDRVMKKYDREYNTRLWTGQTAIFIKFLSALFSLYCIYVTLFSTAMPEVRLNIFLGLI